MSSCRRQTTAPEDSLHADLPIACSLEATELPARLAEITTLGDDALIDVNRAPGHAAHWVGVSAVGGIAPEVALDSADRVLSLILISTCPATPSDQDLPPPPPEFVRFVATAEADRSNPDSVIEYLVDYSRIFAGGELAFDETRSRELVRRDIERARDFAAVQNHDLMSRGERSPKRLSSIASPTLVIHGTADPMFPIEHGEALAEEIPGVRLLRLGGAGHGVDRADWEVVVDASLEHT